MTSQRKKLSPRGKAMGWSVVALAFMGYFAFGRQTYLHYILPIGAVLVLIFYVADSGRR